MLAMMDWDISPKKVISGCFSDGAGRRVTWSAAMSDFGHFPHPGEVVHHWAASRRLVPGRLPSRHCVDRSKSFDRFPQAAYPQFSEAERPFARILACPSGQEGVSPPGESGREFPVRGASGSSEQPF